MIIMFDRIMKSKSLFLTLSYFLLLFSFVSCNSIQESRKNEDIKLVKLETNKGVISIKLFNDEVFAQMKQGSILVNVTRGEIVDDEALRRALDSGHIRGAGLDVHTIEPVPPDHPFWNYDNVVMTPHTAGASQLRSRRNIDRFVENIRRWKEERPLLGIYDKQAGY